MPRSKSLQNSWEKLKKSNCLVTVELKRKNDHFPCPGESDAYMNEETGPSALPEGTVHYWSCFLFPLHKPMFSVLKKEKQARLQPSCPSSESSLYVPMYFAQFRLTLFDMNICDQHMSNPKNIARIAKAALHKLSGKSSLNVRSVCPVNLPWLVCPVCPVGPI